MVGYLLRGLSNSSCGDASGRQRSRTAERTQPAGAGRTAMEPAMREQRSRFTVFPVDILLLK